ncbi:protein TolB [Hordeum vulgare]|nr:protein TolB [Hordeum vulgare]
MARRAELLLLLPAAILLLLAATPALSAAAAGTIVFTTLGRSRYAFDVYALPLAPSLSIPASPAAELRLTDGASVNYNGNFAPSSDALLFVSERNGSLNIYLSPAPTSSSASRREALEVDDGDSSPAAPPTPLLPWDPVALRDRPALTRDGSRLVYVSTAVPAAAPRRSWAAVYATHLPSGQATRLTPPGVADFSPAVSPTGDWTAAASPGEHGWAGEVQDLRTDVYVFRTTDGSRRTLLVKNGGWPCWADDATLFFHRRDSDSWYGVYRAKIEVSDDGLLSAASVERITPPGFHAFTPAASPGAPGLVAVATRRPGSDYRHIEVIDLSAGGGIENAAYFEVTRPVAPRAHHFNPFVSPDGARVGYHRCRGTGNGDSPLLLESLKSPASESLFRIDGSYPSFSPDGRRIAFVGLPGLYVVNSDGSGGRRKIFSGNAFPTSWDWKRKGVIYTSIGPDFASESTEVDVVAVSLGDDNDDDGSISQVSIKKLTVGGENNAFPSPSPDGKWLVFRSGRSGHKNLYIMDAEEGEAGGIRRLTDGPWTDTMCNWSPDGEWIAFASDRHNPGGGSFAIYMVHPNSTGLRRVVHSADGGRTNHPWFSPDSKRMVFTSDLAAVSAEPISNPHHYQPYGEIFTINIDGSGLQRLTHNSFEDGTPSWTPHFLEPRDVGETLQASGSCAFQDCHWLSIEDDAQPASVGLRYAHGNNKIGC